MKQIFELKKLSSVCDIVSDSPKEFIGIKNYYSTGAINNESYNIVAEEVTFLNRPSRANSYPKLNDIGFAKMKFTNKVILVDNFFDGSIFSTGFCFLRPKNTLDSRYLYHFVISHLFQTVKDLQAGDGIMGGIKNSDVKDIEIPLPPLQEQQRIVAILDKAFAAIAKAKANAEQNLKNAKELFESYLQGVFENKGEGWEEKEFGDVITTLTDYHANGSYEILKKNVELKDTEDYAWMVRSTDFENDFENDFRYTDEKGYNFLSKSKVFGGEIIMSKIGNAGNVYLMPEVQRPCSLAMNLFLIRLDEKKAIPEYAFHYLKSKKGDIQIKSRLLGMATKTITKDNVRNIIISFPTLQEQQNIVQKLDALSTETKKLEAIYQQKINYLDELKKSVLQKAFSGELKTEK